MKPGMLLLTLLCLVIAFPAAAQTLYDNGPINGTTDAWTINFGYIVSDTFAANPGQVVTGFDFGLWLFPGDALSSVDWSITSAENGGTTYGSGTATFAGGRGPQGVCAFHSTNQYGYNIDDCTASNLNVTLGSPGGKPATSTYWLNLQNAVVPSGDPVYWDENSGIGCNGSDGHGANCPSMASESAIGTIPSEAFTIYGSGTSGTTPEPGSVVLFGSGILGLAGLLRRKLL